MTEKIKIISGMIFEAYKTATYSKKNLMVKALVFLYVFCTTMFLKINYVQYDTLEWFSIINGIYGLGVIGLFTICLPDPADSVVRYDNEPAYDLISLLWVYPIAMVVTAGTLGLFGTAQPLVITLIAMIIRFVANLLMKNWFVKKNEKYIHGIA